MGMNCLEKIGDEVTKMIIEQLRGSSIELHQLVSNNGLPDEITYFLEEALMDYNFEQCEICGCWDDSSEFVDELNNSLPCTSCRN